VLRRWCRDGKDPYAAAKSRRPICGHRVRPGDGEARPAACAGRRRDRQGPDHRGRHLQGGLQPGERRHGCISCADLNLCVRHRILAMAPRHARHLSHQFTVMGEWEATSAEIDRRMCTCGSCRRASTVFWDFRDRQGIQFHDRTRPPDLREGSAARSPRTGPAPCAPRRRATVCAAPTSLHVRRREGRTHSFAGTVRGTEIRWRAARGHRGEVEASGTLRGALRPAPWAEMPAHCSRYYGR